MTARDMTASDRLGIEIVVLVAAWCTLLNLIGVHMQDARKMFFCLLALVVLIVAAPLLRRALRWIVRQRARSLAAPLLVGCIIAFGWFHLHSFRDQITAPRNKARLVDMGQNAFEASKMFFSRGVNPYAFRAQIWLDVSGAPHVTRENNRTYMFGVPYKYGYSYFPWTFISYEAFRRVIPNYNAFRLADLVFLLLNIAGMCLLAARLAPRDDRLLASLAMAAAFLGAKKLGYDLFSLGIIDILIPCYVLFGYLALSRERDVTAGVLLGMAQACKLLPGAMLALVTLCWYRDRRRRLRFLLALIGFVALVIGPFFLWDPEAFISATILFYLTFHADGDSTSYYHLLPKGWRGPFQLAKWLLVAAVLFFGLRRSHQDVKRLVVVSAVSYLIFIAFSTMVHLNYVWSVLGLGSAALVFQSLSPETRGRCPTSVPEVA
jgi:hypothetical protein